MAAATPRIARVFTYALAAGLALLYVGPAVGLYPPQALGLFSNPLVLGSATTLIAFLNARQGGPLWASLALPALGLLISARLWDLLTAHFPQTTPAGQFVLLLVGLGLGAGVVLLNRVSRVAVRRAVRRLGPR